MARIEQRLKESSVSDERRSGGIRTADNSDSKEDQRGILYDQYDKQKAYRGA